MPRPKKSSFDQSYKLQMELTPLFASVIPAASRRRLAKHAAKGGILLSEMDEYIHDLAGQAEAKPIIYVSQRMCRKILDGLELKTTPVDLHRFFRELNSAFLEYRLRIAVEQLPLSSWLPRY